MTDPFEIVGLIGGCCTVALATRAAWIGLRRWEGRASAPPPAELTEMRQRLTEIERTTEAIAVEMERVGEAQRFTARLLSERLQPPRALGLPDTAPVPIRESGRVITPH